ncbi:hypothetical protein [uncultured Mediterranean phage uvMED]|jgi:hypothetical protein|nr:hypothetical protein HTVC111P_gp55 [Pelagibacter phage HTVC111P]BAQ91063.1 hypothetical protein [uncultured Mediterranean phage uvMED]BAQ91096.1 hypothetical protein [uncultured Mediterranean phage uvMED]BAQ91167.1 hypothetical protein [uncultured Mediterranean phage uvMED]BAQ91255.1 hypothetical protein [uncultured Mediterranean phage uvMED]|tara:strand:+ start:81 stop:272 length:192 start_codon:yes stop_codon:yes gene_type:complete
MITIDGKEYTREKMSDEQVQLFGIISSLSNKKQEHIQKAEQKEILIQHYITKFKEVTSKKEKT